MGIIINITLLNKGLIPVDIILFFPTIRLYPTGVKKYDQKQKKHSTGFLSFGECVEFELWRTRCSQMSYEVIFFNNQ